MKLKRNHKRVLAYFCMPVIFTLLGYFAISLVLAPFIKPYISVLNLALLQEDIRFDGEVQESIFDGNPNQATGETIKGSDITLPGYGVLYGKIKVEGTSVDAPLYFGDADKQLKNGAGQYNGSSFPGCGSTVLIGGHNQTYFKGLKNIKKGAAITVTTNYGVYVYEVTGTDVKLNTDKTAFDLQKKEENLVLYTCYPFETIGLTPQRFFVYAKYISGPKILIDK